MTDLDPIQLTRFQDADGDVFRIARLYLPEAAAWAARSRGRGPWNDFIHEGVDDTSTFALHDGERRLFSSHFLGSYREAAKHQGIFWNIALYGAMKRLMKNCLEANEVTVEETDCLCILRAGLAIIAWRNKSGAIEGRYLPAPEASGHEIIDEPAAIERCFPGRFRFL